ncbi:MAG: class A beta-lactamase [Mycobacteriaceae bacterium]|nr:class A beta-lactamase [Mycobacteriaceae bacterium]
MSQLSRRRALLGGLTLAAAACARKPISAGPASSTLSDPAEPLPPIDERIAALENRHNAVVGLFAADLNAGRSISHRAQDPFAMCSTFKCYASARVLQMVQHGELTLQQTVVVDPAAIVANSPRTQLRAGGQMTLAELCQAALQVSDNTAANLLLKMIGGPAAVTAFAHSIGDDRTRLDRWETELNAAIPGDPRDTSTPEALGGGYRQLLTGDVLDTPQRRQLENWMRANETSSMRAGLAPGWTTADKSGSGDYGSTNDVGIAYGPTGQQALLALMTRTRTDEPKAQNLRPLIAEVTTLVLPALFA